MRYVTGGKREVDGLTEDEQEAETGQMKHQFRYVHTLVMGKFGKLFQMAKPLFTSP